jgi:hypothetical protein
MLTYILAALLAVPPGALKIETAVFKPAVSSAAIAEPRPRQDELGGTLHLFVRNTGKTPLPVGEPEVNGVGAGELIRESRAFWWRALPPTLAPGELGVISLNAPAALFAPGKAIRARLHGKAYEATICLRVPLRGKAGPTLAFVYFEDRICRIFIRNDSPAQSCSLDSVRLEGVPTGTSQFLQRVLGPGETGLIRLPLKASAPDDRFLMLRVTVRQNRVRTKIGAPIRLLPLFFPIGTRESEAWHNETRMADLKAHHINTLVWAGILGNDAGDDAISPDEVRAFDEFCPKYGMKMLTFQGYPSAIDLDFLKRRDGNPRIAAAMICDEPDRQLPQPGRPEPITAIAQVVEKARAAAPRTPLYINLARSRRFGEYAPLADIPSMDAYRVGAPKPDVWPHAWGGLLETAGDYTWDIKRNGEPAPAWVWAQGVNTWDARAWAEGKLGQAVPTPDEARAQLYFQLGRGAKGVMWFATAPEDNARRYYSDPKNADVGFHAKPQAEREALAEQIAGQFRETYAAMGRLSLEIKALSGLLARSEPSGGLVTVTKASHRNKLDAAALVGERAAIVFLTNYDYAMKPTGYVFTPQTGVEIRVDAPDWIAYREAFWVSSAGVRPAAWKRDGKAARVTVGEVPVGAILVLTGDPAIRKEISALLAQL